VSDQQTPDYLQGQQEEVLEDALARLSRLVDDFQDASKDVDEAEEALRLARERKNKLGGEEIPQLLRKNGLSSIRLSNGKKVTVRTNASVTVTDEARFQQWLTLRREDDIVKLHVAFARMEPEKIERLFEFLGEKEYDFESERAVHPQTLKKYFRELMGIGVEVNDEEREAMIAAGTWLRKEDPRVQEFAKVFEIYSTTVR
jgi:hypothetical protein